MVPDFESRPALIGVLQLVDTLDGGGMERVCVAVANSLPRDRFRSFLCTSRRDGPLVGRISPDVGRLTLARKNRFDLSAIRRLIRFVRDEDVRIIHAHGPSVFLALVVAGFSSRARVVWHVHAGRLADENRGRWPYGSAAIRAAAVFVVSAALKQWAERRLGVPPSKISLVPNFADDEIADLSEPRLPGDPGSRVVCVANLRAAKDHETLLSAMKIVLETSPAHLLLVGAAPDPAYRSRVDRWILDKSLRANVTWMGPRSDVPAILKAADIGVLSSRVEGLPVALIEYGAAGLPVAATEVGACGDVLDGGRAGLLVPPGDPQALAVAIRRLLRSPEERKHLGEVLRSRVRERFGKEAAMALICSAYERVLATPAA